MESSLTRAESFAGTSTTSSPLATSPDFEPQHTSVEPPRTADAAGSQALFEPASLEAAGGPERTGHAPRNLTAKGREIPEALNKSGVSHPEDEALGRSRGGLTTKLHLACDGRGRVHTSAKGRVSHCPRACQQSEQHSEGYG